MLSQVFTEGSPYRKAALAAACLWTLGIFAACLWPGRELPHSDIPFIDKWTHFILFGVFSFLWLCVYPSRRFSRLLLIGVIAAALGILIEYLQGWLPQLGRSKDAMDALADAIGGVLGAGLFWCGVRLAMVKQDARSNADHSAR